ncbi:hypothetical protein HUK80_06455 [Flavobacterium sp. MAH-1]|uniref:DUF4252 domain-containing protein n=1 Tax=Flavobacterium agri TaxID=2743471 RepID=A0A7Y8Y184_9FLAO|nr:hypothetical protein [Flavobacterium agri]NUY80530.1 hypothetical protein [Flavobacterium agri]NYA70555.1 hypothetical protein [Flavobacterium agri]
MKPLLSLLVLLISFAATTQTTEINSTEYGFSLSVPSWMTLATADNPWEVDFPPLKNTTDKISIKGFHKKEFQKLQSISAQLKKGNKFEGKTIVSIEKLEGYLPFGETYKVVSKVKDERFLDLLTFVDTSTGHLLIDFASSNEAYELNVVKFRSVISDLKIN